MEEVTASMEEEGICRWAFNTSLWLPGDDEFQFLLDLLPSSEHRDVNKFIHLADRKRTLVSRLLQRKLVHSILHVPYDEIQIHRTKEGKPYLTGGAASGEGALRFPNFNFNATHHGDVVAAVSEPLCIVGVDVMTHEDRGRRKLGAREFVKAFETCYTDAEWRTVYDAGSTDALLYDQFYRYWCMKEAFIKAVGIGLGFELQRSEFRYEGGDPWAPSARVWIDGHECPHWRFFLHRIGDNHWACVGRGPPSDAIESYRRVLRQTAFDNGALKSALEVPEPPFTFLTAIDLVPEDKRRDYQRVMNAPIV